MDFIGRPHPSSLRSIIRGNDVARLYSGHFSVFSPCCWDPASNGEATSARDTPSQPGLGLQSSCSPWDGREIMQERFLGGTKNRPGREWGRRDTGLSCCIFNTCFYSFYPKCAHKMFWVRLWFLTLYLVVKNPCRLLPQCWPERHCGNSLWQSFCTNGPIAHRWGTKRNEFSLIMKKRWQLPSWKDPLEAK